MRATVQIKTTIVDDENKIVYEVDKQQDFERTGEDSHNVYCNIFDLLENIQYNITEISGMDIDDFI